MAWYDYLKYLSPAAYGNISVYGAGRRLVSGATPKYREQTYQTSPEREQLIATLQQMLSGQDIGRMVTGAASRRIGGATRQAYGQATQRFANDPALLMNALARIHAGSAAGYTEAAEKGATAQANQRRFAAGQMGQLATSRERIEAMLQQINLAQRQKKEEFYQDILAGIFELGGQLGGAYLGGA